MTTAVRRNSSSTTDGVEFTQNLAGETFVGETHNEQRLHLHTHTPPQILEDNSTEERQDQRRHDDAKMDTHADMTNGLPTQWAAGARTNAYEPVNTCEPLEAYVAVSTYEPANADEPLDAYDPMNAAYEPMNAAYEPLDAYEPEGGYEIPPPLQAMYPTAEAAEAAIHAWTKTHGYNVSRQTRTFREGVLVERFFACDRHGRPQRNHHKKGEATIRPMKGSKKIGCPMRVEIRKIGGEWKVLHTRDGSTIHNHEPSVDIRVHVAHRQRAAAQEIPWAGVTTSSFVAVQSAVGVATTQQHAAMLIANRNPMIIPQDIANIKARARRALISAQTPIEALFDMLDKHGFYYKWAVNPSTNELLYLLWAHPITMQRYQEWPDVLIADCTYKTNKYRLPLFNMVVVTGLNTVPPVAQCWMPGEAELDFSWAFGALKELQARHFVRPSTSLVTDRDRACMKASDEAFPDAGKLVCRWHMNRNVLAKTRKVLGQVRVLCPGPFEPKFQNSAPTNEFMNRFFAAAQSDTYQEFKTNCKLCGLTVSFCLNISTGTGGRTRKKL